MDQMGSQRATSGMFMEGEMNFKVGDKVRVRQWEAMMRQGEPLSGDISFPGKPWLFLKINKKFCGQAVTIKEVMGVCYRVEEDNGSYHWIDEMFEGYAFKYGETTEMSDDGEQWERKIYVGYIDGADRPYVCVDSVDESRFDTGKNFAIGTWRYARPVQHTIIIDGIEIGISDSIYRALKEKLCGGRR